MVGVGCCDSGLCDWAVGIATRRPDGATAVTRRNRRGSWWELFREPRWYICGSHNGHRKDYEWIRTNAQHEHNRVDMDSWKINPSDGICGSEGYHS